MDPQGPKESESNVDLINILLFISNFALHLQLYK